MYVRSRPYLPQSFAESVTDECSKHNGKWKGLLYRASEASRLSPAWWSSGRRLILIGTIDFPFFFLQKNIVLHSEWLMVLVLLHDLERRIIDTLLRRLYGYDGGTYMGK